jgi:hypothetical protein
MNRSTGSQPRRYADLLEERMITRCGSRVLMGMMLSLCLCLGCARGPYVTFAREEGVVGYRVAYVEATPEPGTRLPEGRTQAFSVTVNYMLAARDKGNLVLEFTDGRGRPILDEATVTLPIVRTRMQAATITRSVRIPEGLLDVVLRIGVIPDGEHQPRGWLQVRYPTITSE